MCASGHALIVCTFPLMRLRLASGSGFHRAPTVALMVMARLQSEVKSVKLVDAFPMSLPPTGWQSEAQRLIAFFRRRLKLQC